MSFLLAQVDLVDAPVVPPSSTFTLLSWLATYLAIYFGWGILSTSATITARKYVGKSTAIRWLSAAVGLVVVAAVPALAPRLLIPSAVLLATIPILQSSLSFYRRKSGGILSALFFGVKSTTVLAYRLVIKSATAIGSGGWLVMNAVMKLDWERLKEVPDRVREVYFKFRPPEEGREEPREIQLLQDSGLPVDVESDPRLKTFPRSVSDRLVVLLRDAVSLRAREVHMTIGGQSVSLSFRVDGEFVDGPTLSFEEASLVGRAIKMLCGLETGRVTFAQEGVFPVMVGEVPSEVFVGTAPAGDRETLVMRLAVDERELITQGVVGLGFDEKCLEQLRSLLSIREGFILVTGRPDAGRGTTLYAIIEECARNARAVATVEVSVQHRLSQVPQTVVAGKRPADFAKAIDVALLQDPDVLVVRDILDAATADLCMRTALSGRLVIAGFAANDSATAVERLIMLGADRALLKIALAGVISQRLVRVLCESCKSAYQPSSEVLQSLGIKRNTSVAFQRETGCNKCRGTGFKGRTGTFELVAIDEVARNVVWEQTTNAADRKKALRACTLRTLQRSAVGQVVHGITSLNEIKKVLK